MPCIKTVGGQHAEIVGVILADAEFDGLVGAIGFWIAALGEKMDIIENHILHVLLFLWLLLLSIDPCTLGVLGAGVHIS
jgi:hypothetical protein